MASLWRCISKISRSRVQSSVLRPLAWTSITRSNSTSEEIIIPEYTARVGEEDDVRRRRLLYQSRKRGMLENGLLLSTFAEKYLESLTPAQLAEYDSLINKPSNDWQIYYWVTGKEEIPADYCTSVMRLLQQHASNEQKETRIRQPDLYTYL